MPAFYVRDPIRCDDDDWTPITARDARHAAEQYGEYDFCERDGWEREDSFFDVEIRRAGSDDFERWTIQRHTVPEFSAEKADRTP